MCIFTVFEECTPWACLSKVALAFFTNKTSSNKLECNYGGMNDVISRYGQGILVYLIDASIVLVEVEEVRGERRGFLADVGDQLLHLFLDESHPIDRPCFGQCPEDGGGHGYAQPLEFSQVEDWEEKFYLPTLPTHPREILRYFPHSLFTFGKCGHYIPKRNRNEVPFLPNLQHCDFSELSQILSVLQRNLSNPTADSSTKITSPFFLSTMPSGKNGSKGF